MTTTKKINTKSLPSISLDTIVEMTHRHFPRKTFNAGQLESIVTAVNAYINQGKSNVIIHAPTGTGKTYIGITIAKILDELKKQGVFNPNKYDMLYEGLSPKEMHSAYSDFATLITTTTISLQEQYVNDVRYLLNIKSKTNYPCNEYPNDKDYYYGNSKCKSIVYGGDCDKSDCPYFTARTKFTNTTDATKITNSAFMFNAPLYVLNKPFSTNDEDEEVIDRPFDLMIIDECHEFPEVIISNTSIVYNSNDLDVVPKAKTQKNYAEVEKLLKSAFSEFEIIQNTYGMINKETFSFDDYLYKQIDHITQMLNNEYDSIHAQIDAEKQLSEDKTCDISSETINRITFLEQCITKLNMLLNFKHIGINDEQYVYTKTKLDKVTTHCVKPINSNPSLIKSNFHDKSILKLFMSATLPSVHTFCEDIGIDLNDTCYIDLPSNIPVSRRPIAIATNSVNNNKSVDMQLVVDMIDTIIYNHTNHERQIDSDNCAIHTASYKQAQDIVKLSKYSKRMIILDSQELKDKTIERMKTQKGIIIVSPSISTGIDLKGDIARYQIITKVPFLNLGDDYIKVKNTLDNEWYILSAIITLIQSCGRISRNSYDYGKTYIIDSNMKRLMKYHKDKFPKWFLDALRLERIVQRTK